MHKVILLQGFSCGDDKKKTQKWKNWFRQPTKKTKESNKKHKRFDDNLSKLAEINRERKTTKSKSNGNVQTTSDYSNFIDQLQDLAHEFNVKEGRLCTCGKCLLCNRGGDGMVKKTML